MMQKVVLIVDDDPLGAEAVRLRLLQAGYAVHVVGNGRIAVAWLYANKADLVILDIVLPELSGFDVCRSIRANPETARTPVIFLTARDSFRERAEAHAAGGNVYATKATPPARVVNLVDIFLTPFAPSRRVEPDRAVSV